MNDDIDFARASALMDVIQKVTTVSPGNTSILGLAQEELREMEERAKEIRLARAEERNNGTYPGQPIDEPYQSEVVDASALGEETEEDEDEETDPDPAPATPRIPVRKV